MSPIFNHHALHGLPTKALEHLREMLLLSIGQEGLSETERANLHVALASIETVLRNRHKREQEALLHKKLEKYKAFKL